MGNGGNDQDNPGKGGKHGINNLLNSHPQSFGQIPPTYDYRVYSGENTNNFSTPSYFSPSHPQYPNNMSSISGNMHTSGNANVQDSGVDNGERGRFAAGRKPLIDLNVVHQGRELPDIAQTDKTVGMDSVRRSIVDFDSENASRSNSGLSSMYCSSVGFDRYNINENIVKGLYSCGYESSSMIQDKIFSRILGDNPPSLIIQSQSGTGKTVSLAISMLCRVNQNMKCTQALCISPTRELSNQIYDTITKIGRFCEISIVSLVKDTKRRKIDDNIVIGTPGTINSFLRMKNLNLKNLNVLLIDEIDSMMKSGGSDSLKQQLIMINSSCGPDIQRIVSSATMDSDSISFVTREKRRYEKFVIDNSSDLVIDAIDQYYIFYKDLDDKFKVLYEICNFITVGQFIIFANTRRMVDEISKRMRSDGWTVSSIHGSMDSEERDGVLQKFRDSETKVLVSTDLLSRGIDVKQVNVVINFDIPCKGERNGLAPDCEQYLHRIGRTGRFGNKGLCINLVCNDSENSYQLLMDIAKHFRHPIVRIEPSDLNRIGQEQRSEDRDREING